ncbi:MAG: PAS domain-containing protein [Alkalispirochaeta sp.]
MRKVAPEGVATQTTHAPDTIAFSDEDRRILAALHPLVGGLAGFLGAHGEVLLHSLENLAESVVRIENGHVTGRSVGSPVTDLALRILHSTEQDTAQDDDQDYRIYTSSTTDGRPLRCVTMVIRNGNKPIGMVCINFDLSVPLHEIVRLLSAIPGSGFASEPDESPEHYMMSAEDLVTRSLDLAIQKATAQRGVSPQAKNRAIVSELNRQGIFDVKGAVEMVSTELGVSRFTVYNYLRDLRNDGVTHDSEDE